MPEIMFPPGRMVGGNLDKLFPVFETNGKTPKIGKDGQPMHDCSVACAIPKTGEQHWAHTPWGKTIYETGAAAHPNLVQSPSFSWKIIDGDSTIPNKAGKRPCDQTGYPGHWVLWFSQGWLPTRCNADGSIRLPEGSIVPGYYIQVYGSVAGNKMVPNGTPGVYLNPIHVALVGEGDTITTTVDPSSVGFGQAPLPAGARPVTAAAPQFAPPPGAAVPPTPGVPGYSAAPPAAPAVAPPTPPVQAVPTAPNMGFVAGPGVAPPPAPGGMPPSPPPAPVGPQMTAAANGVTYEAYRASGWTDDQLRQNGLML